MKKLSFLIVIAVLFSGLLMMDGCTKATLSIDKDDSIDEIAEGPNISLRICCDIGRKKNNCLYGLGLCHCHFGKCDPAVAASFDTWIAGDNMFFQADSLLPSTAEEDVIIEEDQLLDIDKEVAEALGVSSITVLAGTYKVHNPQNKPKFKFKITKEEL